MTPSLVSDQGKHSQEGIMAMTQEQQLNHHAYRTLRDTINQTYSQGRFLAISGGRIIADANRFEELHARLHDLGNDSPQVLIVQAGVDYPETVTIFAQD